MDKGLYLVINNEKEQRFEIHDGQEVAYLEYRYYKKDIALMHTVVPETLSGKGIASALAYHAMEWARKHKTPVIVYCPFVAAWLKRHLEYMDIISRPN